MGLIEGNQDRPDRFGRPGSGSSLPDVLLNTAVVGSDYQRLGVITTAPSRWTLRLPLDRIAVIYRFALAGGRSIWESHADLQSDAANAAIQSGWSADSMAFEVAVAGLPSRYVADVLVQIPGSSHKIIVEVKPNAPSSLRDIWFDQMLLNLDPGNALVFFDGRDYWVVGPDGGRAEPYGYFPTPSDLGAPLPGKLGAREPMIGGSGLSRINCFAELEALVSDNESDSIIIDHTLPWGYKLTEVEDLVRASGDAGRTGSSDFLAELLVATSRLASVKQIVIMVPPTMTFASQFRKMREILAADFDIRTILDLPKGVYAPASSIPGCIIRIEKPKSKRPTVFMKVENVTQLENPVDQDWFKDLANGLSDGAMSLGFAAVLGKEPHWTAKAHDPGVRKIESTLESWTRVRQLGELAEVFVGAKFDRAESKKGTAVVRARDLSHEELDINNLARYDLSDAVPERVKIQAGDILLQAIGEQAKIRLVESSLSGAVAGDTVIVIRPKQPTEDSQSVFQFLSSTIGRSLVSARSTGATIPRITISDLRTIPIPILTRELQASIDELARYEQSIHYHANAIRSARESLYNVSSLEEFESRAASIAVKASSLTKSLDATESLEFQIRNFYPFPLAYCYRIVESEIHPEGIYKAQLRLAENILAFLGSTALALVDKNDRPHLSFRIEEIWQKGITPGSWIDILRKSAIILKTYTNNPLAVALSQPFSMRKTSLFDDNLQKVVRLKNDDKHDRGPKLRKEYELAIEELRQVLTSVLADLAFFVNHPIQMVYDTDVDRLTEQLVVRSFVLTGDHPAHPKEERLRVGRYTKRDLYVRITDSSWVPLFPFIKKSYCEKCKHEEVFFVDQWSSKGCQLKSFERGDSIKADLDIQKSLEQWQTTLK